MSPFSKLIVIAFTLAVSACSDGLVNTDGLENGAVVITLPQPAFFEGTSSISYRLSRPFFEQVVDTIGVVTNDTNLRILVSAITAGPWHLEAWALDRSSSILYEETIDLEVKAGEKLDLRLRWGNNAGNALEFDGGASYIDIQTSAVFDSISRSITIEAWIKPVDQYYNTVLAKGSSNFLVQLARNQRPGFLFNNLSVDYSSAEYYWGRLLLLERIPENCWSHLAFTYSADMGEIIVFVNGDEVHKSVASGEIMGLGDNLRIGARLSDRFLEPFKGSLDEIRIWNVARSPAQIREHFRKQLTGSEDGLVAYWNFNQILLGNVVRDESGHFHDGQIVGNVVPDDSYAF